MDTAHLHLYISIFPIAAGHVNKLKKTYVKVSTILRNPNIIRVYRIIEQK